MKWKNSFKKGSLAAFVTLALTGSALAMPTGGTVENGSVNVDAANFGANDAIANVANGATITPQTNSIINWEAFNIAQGEALHFNTTNAALLNRVTGAQMSELLGQMTQVGGNILYLVNPNGIHIGGTASFDVSNLTLSTLNVASEDFLSYVTAAKPYLPSQQDAAKGAKEINVDQGAHFNVVNSLTFRSGKVTVADGVTFVMAPGMNKAELNVFAEEKSNQEGSKSSSTKTTTAQGNEVSFHGTVESDANRWVDMDFKGATVNLDRAKFHTPNGELIAQAAQTTEDHADGTWEDTATTANVVQADGLEIVGNRNDTEFWGGKVELKNTTIKTPGEVQVYAYKTFAVKEGSIDTEDMTAGADSVVQLTNTKILNEGSDPQAYSNVWVRGGKIEMNNSELASEDEIRLTASNSLHEVRAEGHIPKELKMEANAENTVRLSNTQLHANQASWQPSSETRYTPKNSISIYGGKVALMGVDIKAPRDVFVYALREANSEETDDGDKGEIKSDTSNVLDMRGATIEAGGVVEIWGGKTQMKASSVQAGKIDIAAANETRTAYPFREIYPTAETSNTLYLEDVKLKSQANAMDYSDYAGDADLQGGQVALKKTEIDAARASIHSGQMKQGDDGKFYLTKGTPLHMDSTKIETPSYMSRSGAVNLVNGSEIKAKEAFFVAAESYDDSTGKATVTKDTNLSLWRSKLEADDLGLMTGGLNAWKTSEVKSQKPMNEYAADLVRKDGSSFTMQRDEDSHIIEGGAEIAAPRVSVVTAPKEPSSPLFPLTPDNAQLSEQDQENIAAGKYEAQDIIAAQTGTEAQSKALAAAVGKINNAPNASSRQKAGVVTGMIQAINEMNTLTTDEKHALQVAVLDAYGAVQEAKTEGSNRTQQANGDAMRLTTTESASANMPTAEEPQDAVHFAG